MISSLGETIYWYSPELRIKEDNFSKHSFGNWNAYLNATKGGLTLKYEMTTDRSKVISLAYKIDKVEFEEGAFDFKN
jgi:hypothetical protein